MRGVEKIVTFYPRTGSMMRTLLRAGFRIRGFDELQGMWNRKRCKRTLPIKLTWGYVYVFAAGDLIKVGRSDASVKGRWTNIKTANPLLEQQPLYVSPPLGKASRTIERAAHDALAAYRQTGEWFRCDRQLVIDVVKRTVAEHAP